MLMSGGVATAATTTAPTVEILDVSPNPVVVERGGETTANFKVGASSDVQKVELSVEPVDSRARTLRAKDVKELENWRFSVPFNSNDFEGKWKATATATDKEGKTVSDSSYFYVDIRRGKADTRISRFSADPYKVRQGKSIYFTGRLQAEFDDEWKGVRNQSVSVYYRANGSSGWKWVASDKTDWRGKFSAKTRAWKSGTFKAVYKGSWKLDGTTSRSDYVRVYRWHR
ncbi:hypothetical protein [Nonomuraea sp. LPB2021202275-12-8]|uniref:hypothetical protein n=1 Tax=Nonomuraea sp. LPB2021202275-12-8 TaxID=3120159 RepID=UPI00300CFBEF